MAVAVQTTCKCGSIMTDGVCLNADCTVAQGTATEDAARTTAKATAPGASAAVRRQAAPRAVNLRGNVD